ncbi:hypothetical protein EX30DRAFT_344528 [Ascodesmis nigricans]|uniref:Uncharacterized protein n=1 Tax=Ascodesmis nigricans TaxID=341454 RepID=A0A4S2MNP0_9PEZI|nr:hypothetical protein EX30DRAFT_344528 [Ascodesmis nigricans]
MAVGVGVHIPLRFLRAAVKKGAAILKGKISLPQATRLVVEPAYIRTFAQNPQLHSTIRQRVGGRWYTTAVRNFLRFSADSTVPRLARQTPVTNAFFRHTAFSPFATTLRPKLCGGAMPRTMGGYSLGGAGVRYFSHVPAAPAHVVTQVSAAMRAFMLNGKDQMNSYRRINGTKGKIGVRAQLAASLANEHAPGAYIDFHLGPTFTSISPLASKKNTLENDVFLQALSADFGVMIGGLTAVYSDIRRLSTLGDLPITLAGNGDILRVRFSGCDCDFVERLCDEVGVRRGIIHEDERFAFAHLAPGVAPMWNDMLHGDSPPLSSLCSDDGFSDISNLPHSDMSLELLSSSQGYKIADEDYASDEESENADHYFELQMPFSEVEAQMADSPYLTSSSGGDISPQLEFSNTDVADIHKFLEDCDNELRIGATAWR